MGLISPSVCVSAIRCDRGLAGCLACWHPCLECYRHTGQTSHVMRYKTVLKRPLAIQKELQNNSNRDNYNKNRNQIKRFSSAASVRTRIREWEMLWLWLKYPSLSRDTLRCTTAHGTPSMETKLWTPFSRLSFALFYSLFFSSCPWVNWMTLWTDERVAFSASFHTDAVCRSISIVRF